MQSYKSGLLTFSGINVDIVFDINGPDAKETIFKYENGHYKHSVISTRHPNIVRSVIFGKKSWGLHVKLWSEGISEGTFLASEIIDEFTKLNIIIPDSLRLDLENWISKYRIKYFEMSNK